jgi:hypothetical protein
VDRALCYALIPEPGDRRRGGEDIPIEVFNEVRWSSHCCA